MYTHYPSLQDASSYACEWEDALNRYVDGELPVDEQSPFFAHLASCSACRETFNAVLDFRRMSRQETLVVPPAADDEFFQRLDEVKRRNLRVDRSAERRPLWQLRAPISLGAAMLTATILFLAGLLMPMNAWDTEVTSYVESAVEQVEFDLPTRPEAVYVFYPGLVVEAPKIIERTRGAQQATP